MSSCSKVSTVRLRQITKRFPGVLANDHIDLEVKSGEIRGLLGENGAGKTTLMNVLYGLYSPDEGEIYINEQKVVLKSPFDAINLGIGMIHQHFMLVRPLTVLQNVILGLPGKFPINLLEIEKEIKDICKRYDLDVDPKATIEQLSIGEQQKVEIIKTMYRGAKLLILDEPTSVLTPQEAGRLFVTLRNLADRGYIIIIITHKLDEAISICDSITVLKNGRLISTVETNKTSKRELAKIMVGREVIFRISKPDVKRGKPVLEVRELEALNEEGLVALRDVSFTVYQREILGVAGVAGNGQSELAEVVTGMRKVTQGEVMVNQRDLTNHSAREFIREGVCYIPEDRVGTGIVPDFSVADNLILKVHNTKPFSNGLFLNNSAIAQYAEKMISEYHVKTTSKNESASNLSGGNIQRLILAREFSGQPKLIVASQPTAGLDIGGVEFVQSEILKERGRGAAVLLISEELDEILSISDRIAVMFEGTMKIVSSRKINIEELGLMMTTRVA